MVFSNNIYQHIHHFGLSINPNAIRGVYSDKTGKILRNAEVISQTPFINGDLVDVKILTDAISQMRKTLAVSTRYVTICFPEKLAFTRTHILPHLPFTEITEAVSWQIASIFPFKPEDVYYDWKVMNQSSSETKIVVTAVNVQLLNGIVTACQNSGIKPISFESSASALSRAIKPLPPQAIITEIDAFGTGTTLVENGVASITTTTSFSASTEGQAVIQNIVASIQQLMQRAQKSSAQPPVFITGEKSSAKLAQVLSDQCKYPVKELTIPGVPAEYHAAFVQSQMVVELPESEKSINLLPKTVQLEYRQEAELDIAKRNLAVSGLVSGLMSVITIAIMIISIITKQQAIHERAAVPANPPLPSGMNTQMIMQKAQKIITLQSVKQVPSVSLSEILTILAKYPVKQFDFDPVKKDIRITFSALDRSVLFTLKDNLDKTGKVEKITIPLSALSSSGTDSITLSMQLK